MLGISTALERSEANYNHIRSVVEGISFLGRAITTTLYVSPDGNNLDGSSWSNAYTTIQAALDAASVDANACTLIVIAPHATNYDINTIGDPTWSANVILMGSHRDWTGITNTHASATSVMKFTGRASLLNLTINCGSGSLNGVIMGGLDGARVRKVYFNCMGVTGAQTALEISGGIVGVRLEDILVHGVQAQTTGLLLDNCTLSYFKDLHFHECATGIQITNAGSDQNMFYGLHFHTCTLGLDLDAGNKQLFDHIDFMNCTTNVDDEVGDHQWNEIHNTNVVQLLPDNFTGIVLATHANANTWGTNTEILAAASRTKPFKIIGLTVEEDAAEKFRIRLSTDGGSTHFVDLQVETTLNVSLRVPIRLTTEVSEIFNYNTQISGSSKSESGGDAVAVWVEIQEI